MDLARIDKSSSTFWSLGNNPTQKVNNLTAFHVIQHLKYLYLLSDKVLAAGSFYFESEITRQVTEGLRRLFEEREILFFIDADMENFEEHGSQKIKKSPRSFSAYNNKKLVIERGKKLDSVTIPLRRPPSSISDKIVELWLDEISSSEENSLGYIIDELIKNEDQRIEIKLNLSSYASDRKKDFVWEYLLPHLRKLKLGKQFENVARRKLSQFYSIATSVLLGVSLDHNDLTFKKYISQHNRYDTALFEECMQILGVKEVFYNLNDYDLIQLKRSEAFVYFREFYFSLIKASTGKFEVAKKILPLFVNMEEKVALEQVNVESFLKSFSKLCKTLKIQSKSYKNSLQLLLNRYETFNKATITSFIDLVNEIHFSNDRISKIAPKQATNPREFYLEHYPLIQGVIINNFKIPKTDAPGKFEEMITIIINWFDNFKVSELELALIILQNVRLFSEDDVNKLLDKMCGELRKVFKNDFSKVNFFGLGDSGSSSGQQFLYKIRQNLNLNENYFPKDYNNIAKEVSAIVFIDDIIGSGRQATDFCNDNLQKITIDKYYCSLLGFENGLKRIKKESTFKKVFTTRILSESDKAFSDNSEIFRNKEIRDKIKKLSQYYGQKLYPKGPLGYDDSQALIAFSHNTPNNTLPIIWASINNEKSIDMPWNPMWERKKSH